MSICSGVFLLAIAGLLDGRRAAVHWAQADTLTARFPRVTVDKAVLFIDDGDILTSAGRAAGLDLCLHIIRKDYGGRLARLVAQRMVIPAFRDGGQAQYIPITPQSRDDGMIELREWINNNIHKKIDLRDMASYVNMSLRTFIRRFKEATGHSPGEWVIRERLNRARALLEETTLSIEVVATQVGFASPEALRHHFQNRFQTSPSRYRARFRDG